MSSAPDDIAIRALPLGGGSAGMLPGRSIIGEITTSQTGNIVVRIGEINSTGKGWTQTAYVVLTPDEAKSLAAILNGIVS
jgi:hypothetical protein